MISFSNYIESFKEKMTDSWLTPRGIFFSEGFALSSAIKELGADFIIESGTAYGGSAEMLAILCDIPMVTIDTHAEYDSKEYSRNRLSKYEHVKMLNGDSWNLIPMILNKIKKNKIAIFIDGPKGGDAYKMMREIIKNYSDRIVLIAVHDVKCNSKVSSLYRKDFPDALFTDEQDNYFSPWREQIDQHMLKINKEKYGGATASSLDKDWGGGYLQKQYKETPLGFGMVLIEGPFV